MLIELRNGKRKDVRPGTARALIKARLAREITEVAYENRSMADKPVVRKEADDGLDAMDKAQLHALAKERGLQLHHMLGADKVRAALRGESQQ